MMNSDTIVAVATPHGVGGIAVIRISGNRAKEIASALTGATLDDHCVRYCKAEYEGRLIDEVVATLYAAPRSYTGEDVVELSCHGSMYVQQELLRVCMALGARLAEPGEFTLRAFLNGKMDLAQSEAVADLIDATSEVQHRLAVNQLRGGFSKKLAEVRDRFVQLTSLLELELDFSDEDVEFADRSQLYAIVAELRAEVSSLVDSFRMGNAIKNGIPVAIVGKPNVGKSTLLNALLKEERAIVSDIPGTTRDTVEDTLVLGGVTFRFIDTAGIRSSVDIIENAGIERSYKSVEKAQMVLFVTDCSDLSDYEELKRHVGLEGKKVWVVVNKCDLNQQTQLPAGCNAVAVSAKLGIGIDELCHQIVDSVAVSPDATMLINARHHEAMTHILEALDHVEEGLMTQLPADLVVIDIREALYYLGQITGQVTGDEVLGNIFSRFCIGK